MSDLQDRLVAFWKENWLVIAVFITGLGFLISGLAILALQQSPPDVIISSQSNSLTASSSTIVVDIEGAVINPGVYQLGAASRMVDLLAAAGGLSADANRDWVAKNLNLSAKITDATKIYIPAKDEVLSNINSQAGMSRPININTASQQELESLPGVGPQTAIKIIAARPYQKIADLLSKKIVGNSVYNKIKESISVY